MAKQLLIYERAVSVSAQRHRDWSVATGRSYAFARGINAAPLVAAEFLPASLEYAIVFAGEGDAIMPSALLGVRGEENSFVAQDGSWGGRYIPAFLRRYPFVFSRSADGKTFSLCIDEEFEGLNQDGRGERLFDSEGNRTQYLNTILEFVTQYQTQFAATGRFCQRLKELDLLQPATAQFRLPGGQTPSLSGFMTVDRERLKKLPDETLLQLARSDELELIHAHLHSLANITPMAQRLAAAAPAAAPETAPEPVEG
ncbi:SapC family protein [Albimonas pacifica]|uniref:SapC protein n=1 Tax=Albimonas pacifica TaxID=1114924 RepID=A0A1I3HUS9_9RHOB|nr:SapC family protein [Albimonas pacifica]SFI39506.1 SapC protein [Albimonas pacifica]